MNTTLICRVSEARRKPTSWCNRTCSWLNSNIFVCCRGRSTRTVEQHPRPAAVVAHYGVSPVLRQALRVHTLAENSAPVPIDYLPPFPTLAPRKEPIKILNAVPRETLRVRTILTRFWTGNLQPNRNKTTATCARSASAISRVSSFSDLDILSFVCCDNYLCYLCADDLTKSKLTADYRVL
jgi:hypothetical protein